MSTCALLTEIKVIKNDEDCVRVAFLPHKHLTMTDQTASRPTVWIFLGGVGNFSGGVEIFSGGLRNFRRVGKFRGGLRNFEGGLRNFRGGG